MKGKYFHQWLVGLVIVATIHLTTFSSGEYLLVEINNDAPIEPVPTLPQPNSPEPPILPTESPSDEKLGKEYGVDYNPTDTTITGSTARSICSVQNKCARVNDPDRRIAAIDDGFRGRGSRYWPYDCCYRTWWNYQYWCYWNNYWCGFWGRK